MGVEKTDYVIVGIKIDKDVLFDFLGFKEKDINCSKGNTVFEYFENLEKEKKIIWSSKAEVDDFTFIDDDSSDSFIVGIVVAQAEDYEGEWLEMVDCLEAFEENKFEAAEKLRNIGIDIGEISVYAFSHAH
jgi:hypothetical protein